MLIMPWLNVAGNGKQAEGTEPGQHAIAPATPIALGGDMRDGYRRILFDISVSGFACVRTLRLHPNTAPVGILPSDPV